MDWLTLQLPKIALLGNWNYWVILLICVLEATVLIGLVAPGTTVLIFAGFLAAEGVLDLGTVILFATIGGVLGDSVSFYLGRHGLHLFKAESRWLKRSHLDQGEAFFKKHGDKSVLAARFIGPIRPLIPFVAGLFKMRLSRFYLFNILGGLAGSFFYVLLGYYFGGVWHKVRQTVHLIEVPLIIIGMTVLISYFWRKKIFK